MSHMNYFAPFDSKSDGHEDHLTRAFLVVLRFSSTALLMFYDTIRLSCLEQADRLNKTVNLPSLSKLKMSDVDFDTQTATISHGQVDAVLSVLLTDDHIENDSLVKRSDRKAIYDGVIRIGSDIVIVIENKPDHRNVWRDQLNPSSDSLPEGLEPVKVPAIIEWKQLIKSLDQILRMDSVGGAEKLMIDDFLSFVSERFPSLNPFDNLSHCGNDNRLIRRRIEDLLIPISGSRSSVRYHRGWGMCLNFDLPEIKSVGVIGHNISKNSGHLSVSLYFGDTQSQSQAFYRRNLSYEQVEKNLGAGWEIKPNFHVGSINTVLLRLECPPDKTNDYYEFWRNNSQLIKQHDIDGLFDLISELETKELVGTSDDYDSQMEYIKTTNFTKFNICPSIGIHFRIRIERARELDDKGQLAGELYRRMNEGLNLVLSDTSEILEAPDSNIKSDQTTPLT